MSTERDELAQIIANNSTVIHDSHYGDVTASTLTPDEMADAILAAGYRKPPQVSTAEELKALRLPAIIDSPAGGPARVEYYAGPGRQQRYVEPLFCDDDSDTECYSPEFFATFGLPATVLLEATL